MFSISVAFRRTVLLSHDAMYSVDYGIDRRTVIFRQHSHYAVERWLSVCLSVCHAATLCQNG